MIIGADVKFLFFLTAGKSKKIWTSMYVIKPDLELSQELLVNQLLTKKIFWYNPDYPGNSKMCEFRLKIWKGSSQLSLIASGLEKVFSIMYCYNRLLPIHIWMLVIILFLYFHHCSPPRRIDANITIIFKFNQWVWGGGGKSQRFKEWLRYLWCFMKYLLLAINLCYCSVKRWSGSIKYPLKYLKWVK